MTSLTERIKDQAGQLGFQLAGVTPVGPPAHAAAFAAWLAAGYAGDMAYLPARAAERADPARLAPGARSLIALVVNYNPGPPPVDWDDPTHGRIARYAWTADYHGLIKRRLYDLDAFICTQTGRHSLGKACVDSAPVLERDFAMAAGLGFSGRNTCLITPHLGSWTFLAALLVPEELDYDPVVTVPPGSAESEAPQPLPHGPPDASGYPPVSPLDAGPVFALRSGNGTCGACTRCLIACPTHAFAGPHTLDARRCISYLTIELRGPIPRDLRPLMGNWIFGCDVCQEVCPYNHDAPLTHWPELAAAASDPAHAAPSLLDVLALDEQSFHTRFRHTPVLRARRAGLVRNACVAAGNCAAWQAGQGGDPLAAPALASLLADEAPLVRGHAAWALGRIGGRRAFSALGAARQQEQNAWVREEIDLALA